MKLTQGQIERFWAKVIRKGADECWLWQAATDRNGYGLIWLNGRMYRAPRISILIATKVMPCPEHDACHSCDTPGCVNPRHLSSCTRKKNMQDAAKRGRIHSWRQRLTPEKVRQIRSDPRPQKDIAAHHNLDPSTVSKIISGKIWKNLPD